MAKNDVSIKLYRRLAKKRYLKGKHSYTHERISVPIPSRLHDMIKPFLNQHLEIDMTRKNDRFLITLHAAKTFRHAENTSVKLPPKGNANPKF
jgi:hypothetical protein